MTEETGRIAEGTTEKLKEQQRMAKGTTERTNK